MSSPKTNELSKKSSSESTAKEDSPSKFLAVPSFLLKTYEIVNDPSSDHIVRWNENGDSFVILKTNDFCEEILPTYFKHQNLSSFVRQLNMYGFHKTKLKNNEQCFVHKYFKRDGKAQLLKVTRKTKKSVSSKKSDKDSDLATVVAELTKIVKTQQQKIKDQDRKMDALARENKKIRGRFECLNSQVEGIKKQKVDYKDLVNFAQGFSNAGTGQGLNNLYYMDGNSFKGANRSPIPSNDKRCFEMDLPNTSKFNMIENGEASPLRLMAIEDDIKADPRRRDIKKLRSPSPSLSEAWKRVSGIDSRPMSPTTRLRNQLNCDKASDVSHRNHYDRIKSEIDLKKLNNPSRKDSELYDFDSLKGRGEDEISVGSNPQFEGLQLANLHSGRPMILNYDADMNPDDKFENLSQGNKVDLSDLHSISDFNAAH